MVNEHAKRETKARTRSPGDCRISAAFGPSARNTGRFSSPAAAHRVAVAAMPAHGLESAPTATNPRGDNPRHPGTGHGWHEQARFESYSVPSSCASVSGNGSSMSSSCTPASPSACGLLDALASLSCTLGKTTSAREGSGHPIELNGERAMAGQVHR